MKPKQIRVVSSARFPMEAAATIPMPEGCYTLSWTTDGRRSWAVRDYGAFVTVKEGCDPTQRDMRACGLRNRIITAAREFAKKNSSQGI